jgi:hypothetical protein
MTKAMHPDFRLRVGHRKIEGVRSGAFCPLTGGGCPYFSPRFWPAGLIRPDEISHLPGAIMTSRREGLAYEPMPIRQRDVLDIWDTALKLYRRNFCVLLKWSLPAQTGLVALVVLSVLSYRWAAFLAVFPLILDCLGVPLIIGATACVVSAAARGGTVSSAQCRSFIGLHYKAVRSQYIFTSIDAVFYFVAYLAVSALAIALSERLVDIGGWIGSIFILVLLVVI